MALKDITAAVKCLDPYQCIPIRNKKYARECTEVHLNQQGAERLSEAFQDFENLEVVWFSSNRLSRIDHLESNFRIREVYLQDNRVVSLAGLRTLKFLRVLLASNNQLRNLDKQLGVLTRFAFLSKLDLFGNPVAEEPDYRLRIIYHLPQVEILDRTAVKGPERINAAETVPNMDKVSGSKPEAAKKIPSWLQHSKTERHCFRMAGEIASRRRMEEELALTEAFATKDYSTRPAPEARHITQNRETFGLRTLLQDEVADLAGNSKFGQLASNRTNWSGSQKTTMDLRLANATIPAFSQTLGTHLAKPLQAKHHRGDVFSQTFLVPQKFIDDTTGMQLYQVSHQGHLSTLGGHL